MQCNRQNSNKAVEETKKFFQMFNTFSECLKLNTETKLSVIVIYLIGQFDFKSMSICLEI